MPVGELTASPTTNIYCTRETLHCRLEGGALTVENADCVRIGP